MIPRNLVFSTFYLLFCFSFFTVERSATAQSLNDILIQSADSGEVAAVKNAIKLGADVDYKNKENGWTALIYASYKGHPKIVEYLLYKGATVDVQDRVGQTALMASVSNENSNFKVLDLLLQFRANPNLPRKRDGWTALFLAAKKENTDLVKLLIKYGADPNLKDKSGQKPLDLAAKSENEGLKLLLQPKE